MKKLLSLSLILSFLGLIVIAMPVSAHVLKVDGEIGAVLHINPDDDPTSNVPVNYILTFGDTTNRFKLPKCNCKVVFQENSQTISTQVLANTSSLVSSDIFVFPRPDVYTLKVIGQPKTANAFQTFEIDYIVRVEGGQTANSQPFPPLLGVGLGLMIILILLAGYQMEYHDNDKGE